MEDKTWIWEKAKRPPASALKKITGGRLNGMTDISPQWRYQILTEIFGPCGEGWKFEIIKLWIDDGADSQKVAWAHIHFYHKSGENWSEPIPGIGGSMFIAKERNGMHTSDEAFKMAITDALSTAVKMIGVAADIYAGRWDGAKYLDEASPETITKEQVEELERLLADVGGDKEKFLKFVGHTSLDQIRAEGFDQVVKIIRSKQRSPGEEG